MLKTGAFGYSLLLTSVGVGAIAGAIGTAHRGRSEGRGRLMLAAFAAFGVVTAAASLSRWQWLSMALLVGSGFTLTTAFSTLNSLVQEMAPEALRGRVLSIFGLAFRGGGPVGSLVAGGLVRHAGAPVVRAPLPANVWSGDPAVVGGWFERQGTRLPPVPDRVGDVALVGARSCPLPSVWLAPHVYYASATSQVSVFLVPHGVRVDDRFAGESRCRAVRLLRVEGETVGIIAGSEADARAFETAFRPILAAWVGE